MRPSSIVPWFTPRRGASRMTAEIVGVVGHVRQRRLDADPKSAVQAQLDYPFMQLPEKLMPLVADSVAVVLRTEGESTAVMGYVHRAVEEIDPREVDTTFAPCRHPKCGAGPR